MSLVCRHPHDFERDIYAGMHISKHFDLRSNAITRDINLHEPIYRKTAAYGHFGRDDIEFPWEKTDKAAALKKAAGL